jgi:hypothetical protein
MIYAIKTWHNPDIPYGIKKPDHVVGFFILLMQGKIAVILAA